MHDIFGLYKHCWINLLSLFVVIFFALMFAIDVPTKLTEDKKCELFHMIVFLLILE